MLVPYGDFANSSNSVSAVRARADAVANNYLKAISESGVKRVVYLSSIGADMNKDNGIILLHYNAENTLSSLFLIVKVLFTPS